MRSQLIPGDKSWQPLLFLSSPPLTPGAMLATQNKTIEKKKKIRAILKPREAELDTNTIRWFITLR